MGDTRSEQDIFRPCKELYPDKKDAVKEEFHEKFFEKGSLIFNQGDKPEFMIYINSGIVNIYKKYKNGNVHLAHILKKGDFYGVIAILMNNPNVSTGIAATDCHLTLVKLESFDSFVLKRPDVGLKMIKFLVFKLASTDIELKLWPKQQFDKFLVVHIEDELSVQHLVKKMFDSEEFRLKQYLSVTEIRDDLVTLVRLAKKYLGFFIITDGELEDGTFCDVFVALESIIRLNRSAISILTGKVDSSEYAKELVTKYNTTNVIPDIVISKVDGDKTRHLNSLLIGVFHEKYRDVELPLILK